MDQNCRFTCCYASFNYSKLISTIDYLQGKDFYEDFFFFVIKRESSYLLIFWLG